MFSPNQNSHAHSLERQGNPWDRLGDLCAGFYAENQTGVCGRLLPTQWWRLIPYGSGA